MYDTVYRVSGRDKEIALTKMHSEHTIQYIEGIKTSSSFWVVYTFLNGGYLSDFIAHKLPLPPLKDIKRIFPQVLKGLVLLHE